MKSILTRAFSTLVSLTVTVTLYQPSPVFSTVQPSPEVLVKSIVIGSAKILSSDSNLKSKVVSAFLTLT